MEHMVCLYRRGISRQGWGDGEGISVSGSKVWAEFSGFQFPEMWESGGAVTLAKKTIAVIHWLLREGWEHSLQKQWASGGRFPGWKQFQDHRGW